VYLETFFLNNLSDMQFYLSILCKCSPYR